MTALDKILSYPTCVLASDLWQYRTSNQIHAIEPFALCNYHSLCYPPYVYMYLNWDFATHDSLLKTNVWENIKFV